MAFPTSSPSLPLVSFQELSSIDGAKYAPHRGRLASQSMSTNVKQALKTAMMRVRVLSEMGGVSVICYDNYLVCKSGSRVHYSEEAAMKLVERTTNVPVPTVLISHFGPVKGSIGMTLVPGFPLESIWDSLDESNKERLCHEISISASLMALQPQETHSLRTLKTHLDRSVVMKHYGFASINATSITMVDCTKTHCPVCCPDPMLLSLPTGM